jgi:hypothetical protein
MTKNRECQICLNYTSFDAPSDGGAGGTLRCCIWAFYGRKAGVEKPRNVPNVRASTL